MLKLYPPKTASSILRRYDDWITQVSRRFGVPKACLQAILYQELTKIDLLDPLADLVVRLYWLRWRLRRRLYRVGLTASPTLPPRKGLAGKKDSSTGYGQIFSYVAIRALCFALDRGLLSMPIPELALDHRPAPENDGDRRRVWLLLHRDPKVNILCTALNLLAAAEEMTGRTDLAALSAGELKLVFTRYNANLRQITAYGEAVYRHYLRYQAAQSSATLL